VPRN
jgi:hypothetical protein